MFIRKAKRARVRLSRMRAWLRTRMVWIPRPVRRIIIGVIGGTVLLYAIAGMILPVLPGVIFLPIGLAILAVEFAWAARWLKKIKRGAKNAHDRWRGNSAGSSAGGGGESSAAAIAAPKTQQTDVNTTIAPQNPNIAA